MKDFSEYKAELERFACEVDNPNSVFNDYYGHLHTMLMGEELPFFDSDLTQLELENALLCQSLENEDLQNYEEELKREIGTN